MELLKSSKEREPNMRHGEHIILRLTYVSRPSAHNANIEVTRILAQARRNNESKGITGALVINEDYFLQSIEGSRPVINELLRKLVKDERHFSLQVIECCEVEQRFWSQWSMKHLTTRDQDKEYMRQFSAGTVFNPYLMTASQILKFIESLSRIQTSKEGSVIEKKSLGL